jgi:hypothetical protein
VTIVSQQGFGKLLREPKEDVAALSERKRRLRKRRAHLVRQAARRDDGRKEGRTWAWAGTWVAAVRVPMGLIDCALLAQGLVVGTNSGACGPAAARGTLT